MEESDLPIVEELSELHPAVLGKLVRRVARAYVKRTGLQHPDMKKSFRFLQNKFNKQVDRGF